MNYKIIKSETLHIYINKMSESNLKINPQNS